LRRLSFALINKCPSIITSSKKEDSIEDISIELTRGHYHGAMTCRRILLDSGGDFDYHNATFAWLQLLWSALQISSNVPSKGIIG